jgi:hypothetical protein
MGFHRPLVKEIVVVSERDGKTSSWMKVDGIGFISLKSI